MRQQDGIRHAVRRVVKSAERMRHTVYQAKPNVGKSHPRHILAERHSFPRAGVSGNRAAQRAGDDLDGLEVQSIGQSPGAASEVPFDSMRQGVHAGSRLQRRRHSVHHIGIDKGHLRNIVRVDTDEFAPLFFIGDDIVNRHLRRGTRGGRHREDRHAGLTGGRQPLEATDIGEFRVTLNNTDRLTGILRRTAADGDQVIRPAALKGLQPLLDHGDGRVRDHVAEYIPCQPGGIQFVGDFRRHAAAGESAVGDDQCFTIAAPHRFIG